MTNFPIDFGQLVKAGLDGSRRPKDGALHPSTHLTAPLRHTQLELAGAPTIDMSFGAYMTLHVGSLVHSWMETILRSSGLPIMTEVDLTGWMPEGWSGRADWIVFHDGRFHLGDLKTIKGEGLPWIMSQGMKEEHKWQLSAYYYACIRMGLPMSDYLYIVYIPKNDVEDKEIRLVERVEKPLDRELVEGRMTEIKNAVDAYLDSVPVEITCLEDYLTDKLAPPIERVQRLYKNKDNYEVKLVPHWRTKYCPFDDTLCDCSTQGQTKIGEFVKDLVGWTYVPRKGYEEVIPLVKPPTEENFY